jgi:dTDP-glucose 4,6-dehydratase
MVEICIIGSNSFSGSSFARHCRENGASVLGISRSPQPVSSLAPHTWTNEGSFAFHQLDLNNDLEQIITLLSEGQTPYVVNFSAQSMVAESWDTPGDWFQTNTVATIKLHDALRKMGHLKKYVHISTPEVYGNCEGFIGEDTAFNPSTPYAVSRAAADMSLRSFYAAYDFPYVITRAANVYGPGQQLYRIIPRTILYFLLGNTLQLHGGGHSRRSFIHMDDVSSATFSLMEKGRTGEDYHISTDHIVSVRELVEMICRKLSTNFDDCVEVVGERLGKDSAYMLSSNKIREELGWSDRIDLESGIEECTAWAKDNLNELREQPFNYTHRA